jgi:F0F1-type ATP synthase assembly protein I
MPESHSFGDIHSRMKDEIQNDDKSDQNSITAQNNKIYYDIISGLLQGLDICILKDENDRDIDEELMVSLINEFIIK